MHHILELIDWMKNCLKDVCDEIQVIELDLFSLKSDCKRRGGGKKSS